jgi:hypothetical protein
MMPKAIAYKSEDGQTGIFYPNQGARRVVSLERDDHIVVFKREALLQEFTTDYTQPVPKEIALEDAAAFMARMTEIGVPPGSTDVVIIDDATLPSDKTYRAAWRHNADGVYIDIESARALHRDWLREMRKAIFADLDEEYLRADEIADESTKAAAKADIVKRKAELRDVTIDPRIDAAKTVDELKLAIPDCLRCDKAMFSIPRKVRAAFNEAIEKQGK